MIEAISGAAGAVAESRVAVEQSGAALAIAEANRDGIKNRIDEKNTERAAIVAARKNGIENAKDGGKLMTLAADLEGLTELLAEGTTLVNSAAARAAEAGRVLSQAESHLARRTDEEMLRRLVEHAEKVDGILLGTIQEINAACGRLGKLSGREPWAPSIALAEALQRRHLTREFRK